MFCVRPAAAAAAGADAANALCALLVLPECVGRFRFRFMVYFCRYYSPRHAHVHASLSPQGNHFALTEQITNFVIFRSFHFVSFRLTVADGGIPEAAAPACLLLFVPVLLLLKSGFLFVSGGFLYTTLHIYPASLFVFSQVCLCLCVCVCTKLNAQLST